VIKFDLHIHSICSSYKETTNIVDESTSANVDVLLSKLEENQVVLFSITDHNRFNVDLYKTIDHVLNNSDKKYRYVKSALSGVEFDVRIDESMDNCHIITIFDSKNQVENYTKIEAEIEKNILKSKEDYYTKEAFEQLLYNIGLNTILIACQRKDINNHSGYHNSLSDSSNDVEEFVRIGYIDALEYQKPKVEGILKNNLKELPFAVSLITGSDCHDWSCYPDHDKKNKNPDFYHSKAKILPTFKGLLMAITSPETRFNCKENSNTVSVQGIKTITESVKLVNGINAIIGENGSGKSTILKFINNKTGDPFVKEIVRKNELQLTNNIDLTKAKYIGQGEIVNKFNTRTLFSSTTDNNFKDIDNTEFIEQYQKIASHLKENIKLKISQKEAIDNLKRHCISYNPSFEVGNYYISIICAKEFDNVNNLHAEPLNKIKKIIDEVKKIKTDQYFNSYLDKILVAEKELQEIYTDIEKKWSFLHKESQIKNSILAGVINYNLKINSSSSARDKEKREYDAKKQSLIDSVYHAISLNSKTITESEDPIIKSGESKNTKRGFCFNRETSYNNRTMLDTLLITMFNKNYGSLEKIKEINTISDFVSALRNCSTELDLEEKWQTNFNKFIENAIQTKEYITDGSDKKIGNTLGEMSISFYKYYTQDSDDWNIFIVDQPEDNISNNNINKLLISYFNSIRDSKQIIFVTHNPLLVVNLDVDNVIYIQNNDDKLTFKSGCLEFEDESTNILDIIAQNMDGGKESIEKRLKVYGKGN
jgi:predicted ATPase